MKNSLLAAVSALALISAPALADPPSSRFQTETASADAAAVEPIVWDTSEIYESVEAWDAERQSVLADLEQIEAYRGRLGESASTLADAVELATSLQQRVYRVYTFASLRSDEDTRDSDNLGRLQQAQQLFASYSEATSWAQPELLEVGGETIEAYIAEEPRLESHAFNLRDVLRAEPHTLSAEGERVIAAFGPALAGPGNIYTQMSNSDIPWPSIEIEGADVVINNQGYQLHRQNADRDVRRRVFDAFYATWAQYESALGQTLAANVQGQVIDAELRNYEGGAREAALSSNNLPVAVYDALLENTHEGLPVLHRYFELRGRMLGIDDLAYYDIYPELVTLEDAEYDIDRSTELTLAALQPFGPDYISALETGLSSGWMHAFPSEGKSTGAYVNDSAYGVHPYVLLNHQNDFNSLSTFAHEWGHAVHSMLAQEAQPFETANYATFVAEMASTINELLLLRHLQANAETPEERLFFLGQELETYRGTFFRQAMFGEFEARIHALAEEGEPLTGERMSEEYLALLEAYHGAENGVMTIDPAYALEWAYIPHFYYNFYVFQYATSIAASTMFTERLATGEEGASEAVVEMLRRGGNGYPHDMFVAAGVDLSTSEPYEAVFARMSLVMDEMEAILDAEE